MSVNNYRDPNTEYLRMNLGFYEEDYPSAVEMWIQNLTPAYVWKCTNYLTFLSEILFFFLQSWKEK